MRAPAMATFDMGAETLSRLTQQTSTAHDDLGAQVQRFVAAAAEALEGKFNGTARTAFDKFKVDADQAATELNLALAAVLAGIDGQNVAFIEGEQQMTDETNSAYAATNFDAARFRRAAS